MGILGKLKELLDQQREELAVRYDTSVSATTAVDKRPINGHHQREPYRQVRDDACS
jgi:hypothetical protein